MLDLPPVIVFEGLPCCGKSGLGRMMQRWGGVDLSDEVMVREAEPTALGRAAALKNDRLKAQFALARDRPVILDRYVYSTLAFEAAQSTGPINTALILRLARDLDIRDIALPHHVMIWRPQIPLTVDRAGRDVNQKRSPEWHDPTFLSRFAQAYRVMFAPHVLEALGLRCQAVHWVTEAGSFPCAQALLSPAFARSA